MPKTVTLRLKENNYNLFRNLAAMENRSLANFIETSVLRSIENSQFMTEFEMAEIKNNQELNMSLEQALEDVKQGKGRFVE